MNKIAAAMASAESSKARAAAPRAAATQATARPEPSPGSRPGTRTDARPDLRIGRARGKDAAANAMIMGFASVAWFGWAHQADAAWLQIPLLVGMVAGAAIGIGCLVARRRLGGRSVHETNTRHANRIYYLSLGFELVASFGGAIALGRLGHPEYIIAWIMAIMGIHFVPLSRLYRIPELVATGVLCIAAGAAGAWTGLTGMLHPAVIAGAGGGAVLLVTGIACALRLRQAWKRNLTVGGERGLRE